MQIVETQKNQQTSLDSHLTVWYNHITVLKNRGCTLLGTSIEVLNLEKGCSKSLFDGIFAAGGITLSQVCVMAGVEPYLVQNWVKRGFVSSPRKRLYSSYQSTTAVFISSAKWLLSSCRYSITSFAINIFSSPAILWESLPKVNLQPTFLAMAKILIS